MKYEALEPWEKEISDAVENSEFVSSPDAEKEIKYLRSLADSMLKKQKNINIRISEHDLLKLRAKALEEGIPYQTYISSLIHKHIRV
jgi:predicted DNA binding CopG/RHH family protein